MNLAGARVVVVGLGESGLAATEALLELGAAVTVSEARAAEDVTDAAERAASMGAVVRAGGHDAADLDDATLVVTSPGVPEGSPILTAAMQRGIEVWSELELGARLAASPYVGVTGTNGKTTTTEMIAAAMQADGIEAIACGNVGYPFSRAAREGHEALVVEASSFQLRFQRSFHPRVSVLLNLAADHLDWHGDADAYAEAKASIYRQQRDDDVHVGNVDDPTAAALSRAAPCRRAWFTAGDPGTTGADAGFLRRPAGGGTVGAGSEPGLTVRWEDERHDLGWPAVETPIHHANAAAAALAAIAFGVGPKAVRSAVEEYTPGAHRGEVVAEIAGVRYVDDSKATNPHAALASIAAHERVVLIAGGLAKGVDLSVLRDAAARLTDVVAIGAAAPDIARVFDGAVPVHRATSLEEAVQRASELAEPGGTVLLAPACASMDMFRDYRERGERFAAAVHDLHGRSAHA